MLGILMTIASFCTYLYNLCHVILVGIFTIFGEYIPHYIQLIISVYQVAQQHMPLGLATVAGICFGTMLFRFIWNAVRGAGA